MHEYERLLRNPIYVTGYDKDGNPKYLISKVMMADMWARLRDRLASIESSTSMLEVTSDYAAHFFDMYVKNHDGKHMTGDRIKILLLNLPFMLRDLVSPEVVTCASIRTYIYILYRIRCRIQRRIRRLIRHTNALYRIRSRIRSRMRYRIR